MELLSKNCKVNGLEALEGIRESYGVVQEGKGSVTTQRLLPSSHTSWSTPVPVWVVYHHPSPPLLCSKGGLHYLETPLLEIQGFALGAVDLKSPDRSPWLLARQMGIFLRLPTNYKKNWNFGRMDHHCGLPKIKDFLQTVSAKTKKIGFCLRIWPPE